jgi:cytoskeleton protein RodZ
MGAGLEFRSIRESRGLTIGAVAAATRIAPRMLEALERDDGHALPPRPYGRGFVAAYARELGLDPAEAVTRYFAQFQPPPPAADPQPQAPRATDPRRRLTWGVGAALIAITLIIPLITRARSPARPSEEGPAGTSGTAPGPTVTDSHVAAPSAVPAVGTTTPAAATADLIVSLTFEQRSWITASADGTRVLYRTMDAGTTETLRARRTITMRVGNAGGVKLSVNGRPATVLGQFGEVRTVSFTARDSAGR